MIPYGCHIFVETACDLAYNVTIQFQSIKIYQVALLFCKEPLDMTKEGEAFKLVKAHNRKIRK